MHGTFLRVAEIVLYTLLNSIPYHLCVLYVFRGKLRFGAGTAAAILTVPTLLELALNLTVDLISTVHLVLFLVCMMQTVN